jgi:ADP-heptose:LPS heptosyltransferase
VRKTAEKLLIIRFSSIGDILQAQAVPTAFKTQFPHAQVHWLTKDSMAHTVNGNPSVDKVWTVKSKTGLMELKSIAQNLNEEGFTHIYDAHSNLRSHWICLFLRSQHFLRRPKNRWRRFLLFKFRKNLFPTPFLGQASFLDPLLKWNLSTRIPQEPQIFARPESLEKVRALIGPAKDGKKRVALVPSAAWDNKIWPKENWKELIKRNSDVNFYILGGPEDQHLNDLGDATNSQSLIGKLNISESLAVISELNLTIANDTGLLHGADLMSKPAIALIGPTAFGYPSQKSSQWLQSDLPCRPCSKDGRTPCTNKIKKKCMLDITPEQVGQKMREMLAL